LSTACVQTDKALGPGSQVSRHGFFLGYWL
jgi:hypothetical protein